MRNKKRDWRTTIAGFLLGIATIAYPYLVGKELTKENIIAALILGVLGYLAKDKWVGYGTNSN